MDMIWLSIYPTGNIKRDGQNHVSIYLVLMDPSSSLDWEVNAIVNFSVYNFLNDKYVITQDATRRHFNALKTEWGLPKFIDLDIVNDPSNGYQIHDTYAFGVEVFVGKTMNKGDCLSMIHGPVTHYHSWKFDNFSIARSDMYESISKLILYPNGVVEGKGISISLFLTVEVSTLPLNENIFGITNVSKIR
ncbi:ubiquitin C-terminal hydrolase 12-like [Gastrolobium bilobum]|uniref:ubiquitin C-terminal hydrolase 12-like n=1 Tax=Gastrolobium bilobum TaxID=150636 RepID=UPI002AAFA5B0|nr:ubiquitin C-terminal hydrolase 12-like [Gastrolobium bilobum]